MKKHLLSFMALASLALLAACDNPTVTPVATEPDIVTVKLALAADKASKALDTIARVEQAKAPVTPPLEDYSKAPPSLMQPVSLRWSGPLEQVVKVMADRAGFRMHVKGSVPATPVIVNVDVWQKPILHVIRDLGLQAGSRADVAVDSASAVIEVRYAPADKSK